VFAGMLESPPDARESRLAIREAVDRNHAGQRVPQRDQPRQRTGRCPYSQLFRARKLPCRIGCRVDRRPNLTASVS
jgi:hypothetical protein